MSLAIALLNTLDTVDGKETVFSGGVPLSGETVRNQKSSKRVPGVVAQDHFLPSAPGTREGYLGCSRTNTWAGSCGRVLVGKGDSVPSQDGAARTSRRRCTMHSTATLLGQQVGLLAPTPDQVRQFGTTPEFHEGGICAIHDGLLTLVRRFEMPDGKPIQLPDDLPPVLSLADADAAFRTAVPGVEFPGEMVPVLAGIVFEFDNDGKTPRSRVRMVNGVWVMISEMAALGNFRPAKVNRRRPALTDGGRLARIGTAMWRPHHRQYAGMSGRFTTQQMDGIFRERELCIADPDRRPSLVGVS